MIFKESEHPCGWHIMLVPLFTWECMWLETLDIHISHTVSHYYLQGTTASVQTLIGATPPAIWRHPPTEISSNTACYIQKHELSWSEYKQKLISTTSFKWLCMLYKFHLHPHPLPHSRGHHPTPSHAGKPTWWHLVDQLLMRERKRFNHWNPRKNTITVCMVTQHIMTNLSS